MNNHQEVKRIIEEKICERHHLHPKVYVNDGRFTLTCCCDNFKMECYNKIIAMLKEDRPVRHLTVAH